MNRGRAGVFGCFWSGRIGADTLYPMDINSGKQDKSAVHISLICLQDTPASKYLYPVRIASATFLLLYFSSRLSSVNPGLVCSFPSCSLRTHLASTSLYHYEHRWICSPEESTEAPRSVAAVSRVLLRYVIEFSCTGSQARREPSIFDLAWILGMVLSKASS